MERGSPHRQPSSPLRTNNRLRLCAYVSSEDISHGRVQLSPPTIGTNQPQIHIAGSTKSHSKSAFENVYNTSNSQNEIATSLLPELLHTFFNGNDCSLLSFGGKSKGKTGLLYGNGPASPGIVQTTVESVFNMIEECRGKQNDIRLQLRLSALHYSQRENTLTDLLSTFNPDPRRRPVRIAEDSRFGTLDIENESLIKVESSEQALFYLNSVIDHRLVEDEETYRTNHLFIFFSLYGYKTNGAELEGGRRRFCIADVGIGERNSQKGDLTMPVIGSILLALLQGQKHLPSRENTLCQLIRCGLYSSRLSTLLCTFSTKTDDNENILQLASKLARVRRNKIHVAKPSADSGSTVSASKRSELESGSEMSTVDTVIYMGPSSGTSSSGPRTLHRSPKIIPPRSPSLSSKVTQTSDSSTRTCSTSIPPMLQGHTPFLSATLRLYNDLCSPPGTSYEVSNAFGGKCNENRDDFGITIAPPKKLKSRPSMDDEKRMAIMDWIEQCDHGSLCIEDDRIFDGSGVKECVILSHPLEDIIEMDEESLKESLRSRRDSHPLRILSKEALDKIECPNDKPALVRGTIGSNGFTGLYLQDSDEDALERAMEASVSSMRSHEILSRLHNNIAESLKQSDTLQGVSLTTGTPSEMDLYRRASQLEEYAMQRVKQIEDEKNQKKSKLLLNCCQASMLSSGSTVIDNNMLEKRQKDREEDDKRRDELKARRQQLKLEESELRRERQMIDKQLDGRSLPSALMRQITYQLHNLSVNKSSSAKMRGASDSLPSTPTISHKKLNPPCRTPSLTNCSSLLSNNQPSTSVPKITKREGSHSRKTSKSRDKRDRRNSEDQDEIRSPYAKVTSPRLGNGPSSSGRGSDAGEDSAVQKNRKRQSYSASSGYESGAGDYHTYHKDSRFDKLRVFDKRLNLGREADNLRESQRQLKNDLTVAKQRIGQIDDARMISLDTKHSGISQATLVDTLMQENRILEKRLVACQNHIMLVTSFL
ncbi:unnamed protein product [Auanema sp. JU1783]|nr:unnamed protein product [Auanema sp. JU1783]